MGEISSATERLSMPQTKSHYQFRIADVFGEPQEFDAGEFGALTNVYLERDGVSVKASEIPAEDHLHVIRLLMKELSETDSKALSDALDREFPEPATASAKSK
jgi:hypothetical protein